MAFTLRQYNFFFRPQFPHHGCTWHLSPVNSVAHGCILPLLLRFSRADPARSSHPRVWHRALFTAIGQVGDAWAISEAWVNVSSVAQSCPTLCDLMDCSTSGFPVHHQLPELAQAHVHQVSEAIQPSHLSSPSPPAFSLSQHQSLFK